MTRAFRVAVRQAAMRRAKRLAMHGTYTGRLRSEVAEVRCPHSWRPPGQ